MPETGGPVPAFMDAVVLPCAQLVLCWSSSARRNLGLAAAWRCRGQAMPTCRHGGAVVLLLQVGVSFSSLSLVLPRLPPLDALASLTLVHWTC